MPCCNIIKDDSSTEMADCEWSLKWVATMENFACDWWAGISYLIWVALQITKSDVTTGLHHLKCICTGFAAVISQNALKCMILKKSFKVWLVHTHAQSHTPHRSLKIASSWLVGCSRIIIIETHTKSENIMEKSEIETLTFSLFNGNIVTAWHGRMPCWCFARCQAYAWFWSRALHISQESLDVPPDPILEWSPKSLC